MKKSIILLLVVFSALSVFSIVSASDTCPVKITVEEISEVRAGSSVQFDVNVDPIDEVQVHAELLVNGNKSSEANSYFSRTKGENLYHGTLIVSEKVPAGAKITLNLYTSDGNCSVTQEITVTRDNASEENFFQKIFTSIFGKVS